MSYATIDLSGTCREPKSPFDNLGGYGSYSEMRKKYLPEKKIQYVYPPSCKSRLDTYCSSGNTGQFISGLKGHMSSGQVTSLR